MIGTDVITEILSGPRQRQSCSYKDHSLGETYATSCLISDSWSSDLSMHCDSQNHIVIDVEA